MSSTSITVNPRRRDARSPPPAGAPSSTAGENKGTILLRNPLPKYSFEQKKKSGHDGQLAKIASDDIKDKAKLSNTEKPEGERTSSVRENEYKRSKVDPECGNSMNKSPKTSQGELVSFGKLVGSFPLTVGIPDPQTVGISEVVTVDSSRATVKVTKSENTDTCQKDKPVNKVGPLSKGSGKNLTHSVSDSVISVQNTEEQNEYAPTQSISEVSTNVSQSVTQVLPASIDAASQQNSGRCVSCNATSNEGTSLGQSSESQSDSSPGSQLTRGCSCSEKIKHLEEEKQLLKNQLEVQLQVNQELKKLLVASVGDDLQHRVERLTRDKALLSQEIGDYSKKMCEDYEYLDKISIQADMWRSKYLACRVMADELASSKAFYTSQFQECQMAIQKLLNDRHQLRTNLYDTYRGLTQIQDAFDPLGSQTHGTRLLTSKNTLDLARTNQHLVETIKYRLLPSHVTSAINSKMEPDWHDYLTQAESHAQELLSREMRPEDFRCLVPARSYLSAPGGLSVDRFHPFTRFDNLTLSVCCKCKGDIYIV